jgi:hypothetical protein
VQRVGAFGLSWFAERLVRMNALRAHSAKDRFWRIVLKKSLLGDERNFLDPLVRFARGE